MVGEFEDRDWRVAMDNQGSFEIMHRLDADHDHIVCHDILEWTLEGLQKLLPPTP